MEKDSLKDQINSMQKAIDSLKTKNSELEKRIIMLESEIITTTYNKRKKNPGKTSKYKGVSFDATHNVWRAQIRIAGKVRALGTFAPDKEGEIHASKAYQNALVNKDNLEAIYLKQDKEMELREINKREQRKKMYEISADVNEREINPSDIFGA